MLKIYIKTEKFAAEKAFPETVLLVHSVYNASTPNVAINVKTRDNHKGRDTKKLYIKFMFNNYQPIT